MSNLNISSNDSVLNVLRPRAQLNGLRMDVHHEHQPGESKRFDFDSHFAVVSFDGDEYQNVFGGEHLETKKVLYQDGLFFELDAIMQFFAKTDIEKVKQVASMAFDHQVGGLGDILTGTPKAIHDIFSKVRKAEDISQLWKSVDNPKVITSAQTEIKLTRGSVAIFTLPTKTQEGALTPKSIQVFNADPKLLHQNQVNHVMSMVHKREIDKSNALSQVLQDNVVSGVFSHPRF